jgi:eukaryotic-like serine/threonine-protein kinase
VSVNSQKVLSGRYELNERLGSGGMAEVYLGRDRVLGRTIAVKTLLTQFAGDPHFIARFRREAQSAAALNHPNIVGVYDTGSDDGTHYIVMEYIEGRTLRDVIREEGPLLPERAAELAGDVCAALAFAHSHGIVHRDVKPANIMLTKNGEVKVTDFGIARAASSETVTQTATVLGTAQYFSPEQAQAGPVDARSDIYSLGVVLYEMLTRQVPFTGSSPVAIAYKHVKEDPILPSRLNADIPPALEAIAMKALAKNPDNRYQTAQEMRHDLMRAASGKPVTATPLLAPMEATAIHQPAASDSTVVMRRTAGGPAGEVARRRRRLGWILLSLIMLAIAGVVAWAILSTVNKKPATFAIPPVAGKTVDEAKQILSDAGFRTTVDFEASDTFERNRVIRTDPKEGTKIEKNETVTLIVSSGRGQTTVPKLIGLPEADAIVKLHEAGLELGTRHGVDSTEANKGKVVGQNPNANVEVTKGQKVDIAVGNGPSTVPVPTVINETVAQATAELEAKGFVVKHEVSTTGSCFFAPADRVCDQNPDGGTEAKKGSTVTIYTTSEPTESPSPSPSGSP